MANMINADKYRVQARYENPAEIVAHSGKTHRWIDRSAHHTKSLAKASRGEGQRIIKICTPSEVALMQDTGAYRGRRFNIIVTSEGL